jgi:hypothetical protein
MRRLNYPVQSKRAVRSCRHAATPQATMARRALSNEKADTLSSREPIDLFQSNRETSIICPRRGRPGFLA